MISTKPRCPSRGVTWGNFCCVCAAGLSESLDPILFTLGQICNFCDPNLVTFYLFIYLINPLNRSSKNELTHFLINCQNEEHFTFHLQHKYPGTFANHKYEQLSYPKNPKMCGPILVTLLKMQPHYSQSSRENATPSTGISYH